MATYDTLHPIPNELAPLPLAQRVTGGGTIWLAGRLLIGAPFLVSGLQKLTSLDQFAAELMRGGISESIAPTLAVIGALVETLGAIALLVGFATSWSSLLMIAFVIVGTLIAHRFWDFEGEVRQLHIFNFEKNVMLIGGLCLLYVAGGGPFSIDRRQRILHGWRLRTQWRLNG
jgi:putative oxidoreductase